MTGTDQNQFVDTNILIYAFDRSAGDKHLVANKLIRKLWKTRTGCLSIQVLQELYVNITQKVARPLSPETAAQLISDLSVWTVHRPGVDNVLEAIRLQTRYQISFWDAMVLASAQALSCQTLWSEDLNTGQIYGDVTVSSPFVNGDR